MSHIQVQDTGNGKQEFRIYPANQPANNQYVYAGNPVISFELPNSNVLLDPSTLRLTGRIRYLTGSVTDTAAVRLDQYLGINSCFENVAWSSKHSRAVIERINHYPKLLQSILPATNSLSGFMSDMQCQNMTTQELAFQNKAFSARMNTTQGISFCTPVYTGLTMASGNRLPLMQLGGLILSIDIASNQAVFTRNNTDSPEYILEDLSLVGSYYTPDVEEREALANNLEGELEMNVFSSLFSVVQSTVHSSTFSLGMKELVSCFFSFVPASYINNYANNQYQNMRLSDQGGTAIPTNSNQCVKLNFLQSGIQKPFLFELDVLAGSNEGQLQQYYLMALKKLEELAKVGISASTNDPRTQPGTQLGGGFPLSTNSQINALNKINYTLGIPYDLLSDATGVDFNGKPLTINVRSTLDDATANAMYLFTLNKVAVIYNPQGLGVVQ